ncbi:hypothetical protein HYQ46_006428 [Verticillium longisporum]|nr:hypothetical protein HYQ46_006428 [Verticillium longisporum]
MQILTPRLNVNPGSTTQVCRQLIQHSAARTWRLPRDAFTAAGAFYRSCWSEYGDRIPADDPLRPPVSSLESSRTA